MNNFRSRTKINIFDKITAILLAVVIVITSIPIDLSTFADTPRSVSGLGVYNNSYQSADNTIPNEYIISFEDINENAVTLSSETSFGGVTIGADSHFQLDDDQTVVFSNDPDFVQFLTDYHTWYCQDVLPSKE